MQWTADWILSSLEKGQLLVYSPRTSTSHPFLRHESGRSPSSRSWLPLPEDDGVSCSLQAKKGLLVNVEGDKAFFPCCWQDRTWR